MLSGPQDESDGEELPQSKRHLTLAEVAEVAGVSTSTVSRALGDNPRIPAATRQRIRKLARDLGFEPNISARSLRTRSSKLVGVVVPDIAIPFYATALKGAQDVLEAAGYQVVVMNTERDVQHEAAALRTLYARQVDGILIATSGGYFSDRAPVVFFDHILRDVGAGHVSADNAGGIGMLVDHLVLTHGHKRVAYLGAPTRPTQRIEHAPATERLEGFRSAMGRHRLAVRPEYLVSGDSGWTERSAEEAVGILMDLEEPPTAIVVAGDTLALGALRRLRSSGWRVGVDVALVSFDDPVSSDLLDPPMTALARHDRELGQISGQMLLNQLNQGGKKTTQTQHVEALPPNEVRVPLELIIRRSCGCASETEERA